jgi:DinB superfamily
MLSKKDAVAAEFFVNYINCAPDTEVLKSIQKNTKVFRKFLKDIPAKKRKYAYAEGKWTVEELLQHIIDAERVFAYRAVTFARKDKTALPPFDENLWASSARELTRSWKDSLEEFKAVRKSTECLFAGLREEDLLFTGTASNHPLNALALGYVIAGHVQHHMNVITERYLAKKKKAK